MKNKLEKYKIPLISGGLLLSIVISIPIINSNFSKEDIIKNQIELKAASIMEVKKDNEEAEVIKENIENEKNEDNNVDTTDMVKSDIEESSGSKDNSTHSIDKNNNSTKDSVQSKDEEKTKSTQDKNVNTSSSTSITGEKYTVKKGDTLFVIAKRANVSANHIKELNNLSSDTIYENQTLNIKGNVNNSGSQVASRGSERSEDLYWLSRIIHAEAQGESYEGKVAVGNVIINRVNSSKFPNTIKGVVFDKQDGYTQFSPVIDGTIYNSPDAESIKAATEVLNGARPVGSALYFLNPRKSTNFWITQNRKLMKTIGLHDFYY